jgi:AcrR family transcriptional regulator
VTTVAETDTRALRADARRNLERILEAARAVFAEHGVEAPVTEIAERAGVGVATIFRRFPTKDDLLAAVVEQRSTHLIESADAALADPDAAAGFRAFMQAAAQATIGDRGFCEVAGTSIMGRPGVRERVDELVSRVRALLARAKAAGAVRADVTTEDIPILLMAVAQAGLVLEETLPGAWRRYLDIVLDGLQAEHARPLARRAPTRRQFETARGCRPS